MNAMRCVAISVAVSVAMAGTGCTSETGTAPDQQATIADSFTQIDGAWVRYEKPWRGPGARLASTCGAPRGLGPALSGFDGIAVSTVRTPLFDPQNGGNPDHFVRVAAVRYSQEVEAQRAVESVTPKELERCVTRAVNDYLHGRDRSGWGSVAPATGRSFATRWIQRPSRSRPSILQSTFDEEVVGGHDNSRSVDLAVGRSGRVVVTVLSATGSQTPNPAGAADFAGQAVSRVLGGLA